MNAREKILALVPSEIKGYDGDGLALEIANLTIDLMLDCFCWDSLLSEEAAEVRKLRKQLEIPK